MAVDDLWYLSRRGDDGQRVHQAGTVEVSAGEYAGLTQQPVNRLLWPSRRRQMLSVMTPVSKPMYREVCMSITVGDRSRSGTTVKNGAISSFHRDSPADRVERALRLHIYPQLGHLS